MQYDLSQRVAFITGGGGAGEEWNLGKAISMHLSRLGASIFVLDRSEEAAKATCRSIENEGGICDYFIGDLIREGDVGQALQVCQEKFGRIDILVNNAALGSLGSVEEVSTEEWDKVMEINLKGTYLSCRHVLPLIQRHTGCIVNISSLAAYGFVARPLVAYSVSKAGIHQITREIAIDKAADGIRANTVVVGMIDTPMVRRYIEQSSTGISTDEVMRERDKLVPMGRQGSVWEVAQAVGFLSSDAAGFITGTELVVDGGAMAKIV